MSANTSATGGYLTPTSSAPIEDDALADALQAMVVGIVGLPGDMVRPRWQKVAPKQPPADVDWCGIGVMGDTPFAGKTSSVHTAAGGGTATTLHDATFEVRASFYGPNASGNAKLLRDGLMLAQNREEMFRQGMALASTPGATTKTAELVNNEFIGRCDIAFDVRRRVARTWAIKNAAGASGSFSADTPTNPHENFQAFEG